MTLLSSFDIIEIVGGQSQFICTMRMNFQPTAIYTIVDDTMAGIIHKIDDNALLEQLKNDAGLDIGGTLIGMHLKQVAVPVRLKQKYVGKAYISAARVRPKFIGGERAIYDAELKLGYLY